MIRYSVIVPTYNDGTLLLRCLRSLEQLPQCAGELEIVIAIDGSTDDTRELLALARDSQASVPEASRQRLLAASVSPGQWATLPLIPVDLEQNRGRSAARNAAVSQAKGEWLLFLDADLRVSADWVIQLSAGITSPHEIGIGSMLYESQEGGCLKSYQRYLQGRGPAKLPDGASVPARYFYTCNSMVHRELFLSTGGFDERLRVWGGEDIDMGLRLEAAGGRQLHRKRAVGLHAQERSFTAHCRNLVTFGERVIPLLLEAHPQLYDRLQLGRLDPSSAQFSSPLRLLSALGAERALCRMEELTNGFLFPDRLYDLIVYLHYAGAYARWQDAKRKETS